MERLGDNEGPQEDGHEKEEERSEHVTVTLKERDVGEESEGGSSMAPCCPDDEGRHQLSSEPSKAIGGVGTWRHSNNSLRKGIFLGS